MNTIEKLRVDWKVNKNFISRLVLLVIRLEKVRIIGKLIIPIRVFFVNFMLNTEIPKSVSIGEGFRLPHPYGIIIHGDAIIGKFVTIYQGVTVGSNEFKLENENKSANLEDYTLVGANSVLIGSIKIGENSIIAACSLVSESVREGGYYREGKVKNNIIDLRNYHEKRINYK